MYRNLGKSQLSLVTFLRNIALEELLIEDKDILYELARARHIEKKMGAGSILAGLIVGFLGVFGLLALFGYAVLPLNLASVSVILSTDGALVLYGAMAVIGIALIVDGASGPEPRDEDTLTVSEIKKLGLTERAQVVVVAPPVQAVPQGAVPAVVYPNLPALSDLDLAILHRLSERKSRKEVARDTGVSEEIVSEKVDRLRAEGYVAEGDALTEKGYSAIHSTSPEVITVNPSA
jgi:biotin operon repressor